MEHRVKSPSADLVAVTVQFLDHAQTEDWSLAGVIKNVDANQTGQEFLVSDARDLG